MDEQINTPPISQDQIPNNQPLPAKKRKPWQLLVIVFLIIGLALSVSKYVLNAAKNNEASSQVTDKTTPTEQAKIIISPTIADIATSSASQWEIRLPKTKYSLAEIERPANPPSFGYPPTVEGKLFGPIPNKAKVCEVYGPVVEKKEGNKWVVPCQSSNPTEVNSKLFCSEYNAENGDSIFGFISQSKQCDMQGVPIDKAVYRIRNDIYTECIGNWDNIYPSSCKIKKSVYSPEFEVY